MTGAHINFELTDLSFTAYQPFLVSLKPKIFVDCKNLVGGIIMIY